MESRHLFKKTLTIHQKSHSSPRKLSWGIVAFSRNANYALFRLFFHSPTQEAGRAVELWGREVLLLQASRAEHDTKLGLFNSTWGHGPLCSPFVPGKQMDIVFSILPSRPSFFASQPTTHWRDRLKPSFAQLVIGTTSQRCLLPTALLNNNTTACFPLASARPLVLGRGKVVGKFFPRAPSGFRPGTMLGREDGEKIDQDDGVLAYPSSSSA